VSIKLFLAKRFPKIFLPWHQLGILTEAHKYRETHLLIEKVEKDNPDLKDFLDKDEAWKLGTAPIFCKTNSRRFCFI